MSFLLCSLLFATPALAADDPGVPVTIKVTDTSGEVIRTAVVRHPDEQDRHRVHTESGAWTASVLYMPNGSELVFSPKMLLEFEISAPGYANARIRYQVRRRKNIVPVVLDKIEFPPEVVDDPVIPFKRDVPLENG